VVRVIEREGGGVGFRDGGSGVRGITGSCFAMYVILGLKCLPGRLSDMPTTRVRGSASDDGGLAPDELGRLLSKILWRDVDNSLSDGKWQH
jgi:hypothetical protein